MTDRTIDLPRFWKGHIGGTNQGSAYVRITRQGENLLATVIFQDFQYGVCEVQYMGNFANLASNLRLVSCQTFAPVSPVTGHLNLSFDENLTSANGSWAGDNATGGLFTLRSINSSTLRWWTALLWARSRLVAYRWRAFTYTLLLLLIAVAAMLGKISISYPVLILLLMPSPFVFRYEILEFIRLYQIKKIGWVEMGYQGPITDNIQAKIANEVQARIKFAQLDTFYVH